MNPDGKPFPRLLSKKSLAEFKGGVLVVILLATLLVAAAIAAAAASAAPALSPRVLAAETSLPVTEAVAPSRAGLGAEVTVTGSGFGSGGTDEYFVLFGAVRAEIVSRAEAAIVCVIPSGVAGEVEVTVTNGRLVSEGFEYAISDEPEPGPPPGPAPEPAAGTAIDSVSPPSAWIGAETTITGRGFGPRGGTVTCGSVQAEIVSWSDTQIVCIVPDGIT